LTTLLVEASADKAPVVRARTVHGLYQIPLSEEVIAACAPLLSDPSWLVRLAVIELFAGRQNKQFLPVLNRLVDDDNRLVTDLARLYRDRVQESLEGEP
jgi:HEAT repeat protein